MKDGEIQRKTPAGDVSVIRFTSYAFDLSAFTSASGKPTLLPEGPDAALSAQSGPERPGCTRRTRSSFSAELHRRFSEWIYPLVFALIALAVTGDARSHRESRINPLVTAVIIALFVRWLRLFRGQPGRRSPRGSGRFVYADPARHRPDLDLVHRHQPGDGTAGGGGRTADDLRCARIGDRMMFMRFRRSDPAGEEAA